ncbi:ABC transporter permease [Pseudomonas azotoformans]|uniref:ABC transporter permease n=1 Tax=Pseudomonas azotoformans TaxID=47878 RepID=A0A1V2J453_PSEAZ|nr:ABC transporter permease [Pseudomonas azotoformans]OIN45832.1 ABC transporter permease [Pseudomonas azotoformans]ONH40214.1 ABC transporter permease [Pseudomonas azotoformans]SDN50530.1 ABC-2 type transport system permease protein [Pseudomonas azotoformans]
MDFYCVSRPAVLAALFIKEQLREPVALLWTVVSPVVTYYLITYARAPLSGEAVDYLSGTSWFYAFVSSNVALFGLAFYIVGRRESGFLRSFVYTGRTKVVFLFGQFLAYSVVSIVYCSVFYMLTRMYSGGLDSAEYLMIVGRFYVCFLLFSIPALLLTLVPLGFQNASTLFSILSLLMLAVGIVSMGSVSPLLTVVNFFNPLWWANKIMLGGVVECALLVWVVTLSLLLLFLVLCRFLLINPVWSRY